MNFENKYKNKYWISKYLDLIFKKLQIIEQQINGGGGSGTIPTLEQVLGEGSEADSKNIVLSYGDLISYRQNDNNTGTIIADYGSYGPSLSDTLTGEYTNYQNKYMVSGIEGSVSNRINIGGRTASGNAVYSLDPNKAAGNYILATQSAVSGTFTNPTSITIVNGIITAIS